MADKKQLIGHNAVSELIPLPATALPEQHRERMERQARASKAEATWTAYGSDWRVWEAWATAAGLQAMPAAPEHVAAFLSALSATRKISTLRRYLSSVSVSHTLKGLSFDRKHVSIRTILRGIARESGVQTRRVKPLMAARVGGCWPRWAIAPRICATLPCWRLAWPRAADARSSLVSTGCSVARGRVCSSWPRTARLFGCSARGPSQDPPAEVYIQPGVALGAVRRWAETAVSYWARRCSRPSARAGGWAGGCTDAEPSLASSKRVALPRGSSQTSSRGTRCGPA